MTETERRPRLTPSIADVRRAVREALASAVQPGGLVLFSPEVDLDLDHASVTDNAPKDILPWNIPVTSYLHGVQPGDARVSAVFADPAWFPPTFVASGGDEMFRDGIREFVARLRAAGVETESSEEPGMFHVFPIVMPWAGAARRVFADVDRFVDRHVTPAPAHDPPPLWERWPAGGICRDPHPTAHAATRGRLSRFQRPDGQRGVGRSPGGSTGRTANPPRIAERGCNPSVERSSCTRTDHNGRSTYNGGEPDDPHP